MKLIFSKKNNPIVLERKREKGPYYFSEGIYYYKTINSVIINCDMVNFVIKLYF